MQRILLALLLLAPAVVMANEDDGSCANIPGCTDPAADNYSPDATSDDGSCIITGCTDPAALNYEASATVADNDLCYYTLPNIIVNEIHYNPCDAQGNDFDWEFAEFFNAGAEADISGYEVWFAFSNPTSISLAMTFPGGTVIPADSYFLVVPELVAQSNYEAMGITTFLMDNGNWGNSGGTVRLQDAYGNIVDAVTYDDAAPWPVQVSVLGNVLAASPDGGCASLELIATDLNNDDPDNWQNSWVDNGTPGAANSSAFGCTDGQGCNYSDQALFDDGTCNYDCYGCTYPEATNYDETATIDDGTCEVYSAQDTVCTPFDNNGDNIVGIGDLIDLLARFGDSDLDQDGIWDSEDDCVGAYDTCGVCNGPGPQVLVLDTIIITYDSIYVEAINDWVTYELGADSIFSLQCEDPGNFNACGDAIALDGYSYSTVLIGDQCWFAENLRTTIYADGTAIPAGLTDGEWTSTTSGATAVYGEGSSTCANYSPDIDACDEAQSLAEYGRLYNWYAVDDSRGLCPSGWHVPTDGEWTVMIDFLSGGNTGGQLKTTYGWNGGGNGTNSSGFSGLPGGVRYSYSTNYHDAGDFHNAGSSGRWWSSSSYVSSGSSYAWSRYLYYSNESIHHGSFYLGDGFSVRCVRDAE